MTKADDKFLETVAREEFAKKREEELAAAAATRPSNKGHTTTTAPTSSSHNQNSYFTAPVDNNSYDVALKPNALSDAGGKSYLRNHPFTLDDIIIIGGDNLSQERKETILAQVNELHPLALDEIIAECNDPLLTRCPETSQLLYDGKRLSIEETNNVLNNRSFEELYVEKINALAKAKGYNIKCLGFSDGKANKNAIKPQQAPVDENPRMRM